MTVVECGDKLRRGEGECCAQCFVGDTHGLTSPLPGPVEALTANIDRVEANLLATMVLLRTDLMRVVEEAGRAYGELRQRVEALEERLDGSGIDVVDTAVVERPEEALAARIEVLERCLVEIEHKLKLKRRAAAVLVDHPVVE